MTTPATWRLRGRRVFARLATGASGISSAAVVATAFGAVLIVAIASSHDVDQNGGDPDALAYALGVVIAAATVARRRHPLAVLLVSALVLQLYYALGYSAIGFALPLAPAAFWSAEAGHARWSAAVTAFFVAGSLYWRALQEQEQLLSVLGVGTVVDACLLTSVALLGETVRSRRALQAETRRRLELAASEREHEARRRVDAERVRIARDLHDVLAHTISAVNIQAAVAADTIDDAPDETKTALRTIRTVSREALEEVNANIRVLRDDDAAAPRRPAPGLARIDELVENAAAAGIRVSTQVRGHRRPLPSAVDLTAFRIVQESLTNIIRHAHASNATVTIDFSPASLTVEIVDDGNGPAEASQADGFGLRGMRERVAALGGRVVAGPAAPRGFRVSASLPAPVSG